MEIYDISAWDADSYAFREFPELTEYQKIHQSVLPDMLGQEDGRCKRCPRCRALLDKWNEPLDRLRAGKRKLDFGTTYDGVNIVSPRFRSLYEIEKLSGLTFANLASDPDFFAIRPIRSVPFDAKKRGTRFLKLCTDCGIYESVVGATPVFLKGDPHIDSSEIVRTDLEFGTGDEKSPVLLCGELAAAVLNESGLRGIDLIPIGPK